MSETSNPWVHITSAIKGLNDYVLTVEIEAVASTPVMLGTPGTNTGSRCLWQFTADGRILSQLMGQLALAVNYPGDGSLIVMPYDPNTPPDPTQLWDVDGTDQANISQPKNRKMGLYMVPQGGESGPFTPSGGLTVLCAEGTGVDADNISYGLEQVPGTPPSIPALFSRFLGDATPFDLTTRGYCEHTAVLLQFLPENPEVAPRAEAFPPDNASRRNCFDTAEHTFLGGSVERQAPDGSRILGATRCSQTFATSPIAASS